MSGEQKGALVALKDRIEALPVRRQAAGRVDALKKYVALFGAAAETAVKLRDVRTSIGVVFPDASLEASGRALATAQSRAVTLLAVLTKADDIEEPGVERGFADVRGAVQKAEREVKGEWRQQVEAVASRYARLVKALHDAKVEGSGPLQAAVERVGRMDSPPDSRHAALRAAEDISSVAAAVRELGLEGPVGAFLTAAADRRASAASLRQPEVVAFLNRHDLWSVLVVALS